MSPINEDKTVGHMEGTKREKWPVSLSTLIVYTLGHLKTSG